MSVLASLTANLAYDVTLFRSAVEVAGEAVLITSPELEAPGPLILYANPAFARMSGYGVDEVLGRSPRILQGPKTDRALLERMRRELAATGAFKGEGVNYRKDGSEYVVEWVVTAVRDAEGHIMHWVSVQRDVTEQRFLQEQERQLRAEPQHRVRNMLGVVRSVMRRTARTSTDLEECTMHLEGRIDALSRVQSLVTHDPKGGIDLEYLVAEELRIAGAKEGNTVSIQGPQVLMNAKAAETLGLAIHELATNAMKHGALASPHGKIKVRWQRLETDGIPQLSLQWREQGLELYGQPTHQGFGTELLTRTLAYDLNAKTEFVLQSTGLVCSIEVPLARLVTSAMSAPAS